MVTEPPLTIPTRFALRDKKASLALAPIVDICPPSQILVETRSIWVQDSAMARQTLCIVSCTAHKRDVPLPAENLYSSDLFFKSRRFAQANFDSWLILSAKHGLIPPSQIVEPYDQNLNSISQAERAALSQVIIQQASHMSLERMKVTSICGEDYNTLLLEAGIKFARSPEFALPIGKKLAALGNATDPYGAQEILEATYKAITRLTGHSKLRSLREVVAQGMPEAGVYLFFDPQESRMKDLTRLRVVRVGTHGVAAGSKATLRNRMRTHLGTAAGEGNHRSSIFRLHVGRSILNSGRGPDVRTWGSSSANKESLIAERSLEKTVSDYLSRLQVVLIDIPGISDKANDRSYIEQNLIAVFSNRCKPLDPPSYQWLGNYSDKREIRKSGLWNVNHVEQRFDPQYVEVLNRYVSVTLGTKAAPLQPLAPLDWQARIRDDHQLRLI